MDYMNNNCKVYISTFIWYDFVFMLTMSYVYAALIMKQRNLFHWVVIQIALLNDSGSVHQYVNAS